MGTVSRSITIRILILFSGVVFISCAKKQKPLQPTEYETTVMDSVPLYHLRRNVKIPVKGKLKAWQKKEIFLSDSSQLLSLLIEEGDFVKRGALLGSFWRLPQKGEYTPVDIRTPISGVVTLIKHRLGSRLPPGSKILEVENDDYLLLQIRMPQADFSILRAGQKVAVNYKRQLLWGFVERLEQDKGKVNIFLKNNLHKYAAGIMVSGYILCPNVKGDFLPAYYFNTSDSLKIWLDDYMAFTLIRCGTTDSLSLIYPPLPDQKYLKIIKKNLDLSY